MNFTVTFSGVGAGKAIDFPYGVKVGLNGLDMAREAAGVPSLSPDLVEGQGYRKVVDPTLEISETLARQVGGFTEISHRKISVSPGRLNDYCGLSPIVARNEDDGGVILVQWSIVLDEDALLEDWIRAGAPDTWIETVLEEQAQ